MCAKTKMEGRNPGAGRITFFLPHFFCMDFWILAPSTLTVEGTESRTCSVCHSEPHVHTYLFSRDRNKLDSCHSQPSQQIRAL